MAFVVSRKDVGYFGYLCGQKFILFRSPFSSSVISTDSPFIITNSVKDTPPADGQESPKNDTKTLAQKVKSRGELCCGAISNCGTLIAMADNDKELCLWRQTADQWALVSTRTVSRKCFQILFTNSGSDVIAIDRGGDVFSFSVAESDEAGKLIMGHICVILGVQLTDNDDYIITCDRDGKVRVSCYPNTYNIQAYCLGHREFVSALAVYSTTEKLLLTGSGDGTIRLWKFDEGKEILCHDLISDATLFPDSIDEKESFKNDSVPQNEASKPQDQQDVATTSAGEVDHQQSKKWVSIKCLKYCSKADVCAALFHSHSQIAIFRVSSPGSAQSLQFIQYLNFKVIPQDAFFDANGYLWVLLSSKNDCVTIFKDVQKGSEVKFVELEDGDFNKTEKIRREVSDNWRACPASLDVNILYKKHYIDSPDSDKQSYGPNYPVVSKQKSFCKGYEQKLKKIKFK